MWTNYICFCANESDNICNGEAKPRQAHKRRLVLHVLAQTTLRVLSDRVFSSFGFRWCPCYYWLHEAVSEDQSGCTGSPAPPRTGCRSRTRIWFLVHGRVLPDVPDQTVRNRFHEAQQPLVGPVPWLSLSTRMKFSEGSHHLQVEWLM